MRRVHEFISPPCKSAGRHWQTSLHANQLRGSYVEGNGIRGLLALSGHALTNCFGTHRLSDAIRSWFEAFGRFVVQDERPAGERALTLERELLRAAGQETTPGRARRRVLSTLGLLVLLPRAAAGSKAVAGSSLRRATRWFRDWRPR